MAEAMIDAFVPVKAVLHRAYEVAKEQSWSETFRRVS